MSNAAGLFNQEVKVFRNRRQFELKIVHRIIPNLGAFEEHLERLFLMLSNWYCLCCCRRSPRRSQGMSVALIDGIQRMAVISLGLRVVDLRSPASGTNDSSDDRPNITKPPFFAADHKSTHVEIFSKMTTDGTWFEMEFGDHTA